MTSCVKENSETKAKIVSPSSKLTTGGDISEVYLRELQEQSSAMLTIGCNGVVPMGLSGCTTDTLGPLSIDVDGCEYMVISAMVTRCLNGEMYISNVMWTAAPTTACDSIFQAGDRYDRDVLTAAFTLKLQDYVINIYQSDYRCLSEDPCSTVSYAVSFVMAGCYYICTTIEEHGDIGNPGGGTIVELVREELQCGFSCCVRRTPFCVKLDGTICYGEAIKGAIGDCLPEFGVECEQEKGFSSDCTHPCNRL